MCSSFLEWSVASWSWNRKAPGVHQNNTAINEPIGRSGTPVLTTTSTSQTKDKDSLWGGGDQAEKEVGISEREVKKEFFVYWEGSHIRMHGCIGMEHTLYGMAWKQDIMCPYMSLFHLAVLNSCVRWACELGLSCSVWCFFCFPLLLLEVIRLWEWSHGVVWSKSFLWKHYTSCLAPTLVSVTV